MREARIVDLSGGGIRISAASYLMPGARVILRFSLPKVLHKVVAQGRVVKSVLDAQGHEYSHGIVFTQISATDQDAILNYVQKLNATGLLVPDFS